MGLSTTDIYKFFDSQQAVGECVCRMRLDAITADLQRIADSDICHSTCVAAIIETLSRHARDLAPRENRLRQLIAVAHEEHWRPFEDYTAALLAIL